MVKEFRFIASNEHEAVGLLQRSLHSVESSLIHHYNAVAVRIGSLFKEHTPVWVLREGSTHLLYAGTRCDQDLNALHGYRLTNRGRSTLLSSSSAARGCNRVSNGAAFRGFRIAVCQPMGARANINSSLVRARSETPSLFEAGLAILAASSIATYWVTRLWIAPGWANWALYPAILGAGIPLSVRMLRRVLAGELGADLLALFSIAASILQAQYLVATIMILMLSGGTALERYATRRASAVLAALAKRTPTIAHRKYNASDLLDISVEEVAVGDTLAILPYEICPSDGVVVEGAGWMDESYLTGEPYEIAKAPGSYVLSGARNGRSALIVSVTRLPRDSRYAKIVEVIRQAERNRPRMRRLADRLALCFTPFALSLAALVWIATGEPQRFLAVLVIATPCPLLLAIPVAIIGAISLCARRGIVIREPGILERVDRCKTFIFDKTGTLSYGRPELKEIICAPGADQNEALRLAASLEQYSKHPLSAPILEAARRKGLRLGGVRDVSELPGQGLSGTVEGTIVHLTGRGKLPAGIGDSLLPPPIAGLECILLVGGRYRAVFRFRDQPRVESKPFVGHLSPKHGVTRTILLSGDREQEVAHFARLVGISKVYSGKSPEEKVAVVQAEVSAQPTLFVGDGINDAPAMRMATVAVAIGRRNEIAAEAAGAVVLEPSITKIDELVHIGRRLRVIALESAIGGMALSLAGMVLAAAGLLSPLAGAVTQEIIDLAAVVNALRASRPGGSLQDFGDWHHTCQ